MPNILIADDEQEIVKLLRIYLETDDMIIFEANDGAMALDIIEEIDICALVREIIAAVDLPFCALYTITDNHDGDNMPTIIIAFSEGYDPASVADTQTFIDKIVENMDWKRL